MTSDTPSQDWPDDLVHRVRQVLHANNLGCSEQPGQHDKVAREILAVLGCPSRSPKASREAAQGET